MQIERALVIGGAGFIGSHLVDVCLRKGLKVWVFDNFSTGKRSFLANLPESQIVEGDILDANWLDKTIQDVKPDAVFHLAAIHHIPTCEEQSIHALHVNVVGTDTVLKACLQNRVHRIVFTSTGALYDPKITTPLSENAAAKAQDIYGISKHACENLVEYYADKKGLPGIVARLFNTVGRRETNSHVVPAIFGQLSGGNRSIKLGNLSPRRDYIHVEDVAEALFALGNVQMSQPFEIFNVGSGKDYSVQELVNLCSEVIGEPVEVITSADLQRKVDRPNQLADSSRLQRTVNWKPDRSLKQALAEIWQERMKEISVHEA
jgi:UDP-glucose 4-epimerase